LNFRKSFYDSSKDYNFKPNTNFHIETIDKKIIKKQQKEIFKQFINFFKNEINAQILL
jgi:hypothetical protein